MNWTDEQACFDTFLRELAFFYVPVPTYSSYDSTSNAKETLSPDEEAEKKHGMFLTSPPPFPTPAVGLTCVCVVRA